MPHAEKSDEDWDDGLKQNLLWYSIHPCAFMVFQIQQGVLKADPAVMETLDAYGYRTPGGFPDFEQMQRDFHLYHERKKHAN